LVQLCLGAALVAVLATAVSAVHGHHLDPVMVAVLPLTVLATFEPIPSILQAATRAQAVQAAARRLFDLSAVPEPVRDAVTTQTFPGGVPAVTFAQASLRYGPDLPLALRDIDLRLEPGARIAVTGSSGAGKSSLINALLRFWPLESGSLEVGGTSVDLLRQADVRASAALVDQRAQLFAGTLRSNITLGRPDATDDEIEHAIAAAQLGDWVAALPAGLDTQVGDNGVSVSGGERRRVAVARALLAGGSILVLDEPTSGLDTPLADQLIDDVLAAAGERSVLLITHRAAEAQRCPTVVALRDGRVV
jgi:ABC-type transport system involved in cytochrome bd biosynthesis fused ATPase/permease subunit